MDPWKYIKMFMAGAIILVLFAWICFRTPTYPPTPPPAANMISSSDTIAQAKTVLQEFFVAWNARDANRVKSLSTEDFLHDFSNLERIEIGKILFVGLEGQDAIVFSVPIRFYVKDTTCSPVDDGQVLPWTYTLRRGADGRWRVSSYGMC